LLSLHQHFDPDGTETLLLGMVGGHMEFVGAFVLQHLVAIVTGDGAAHVRVPHVTPRVLIVGEHFPAELTAHAALSLRLQAAADVVVQISSA
jgi:hypothetical protein